MNENAKKWVEALRSGDYDQGTGYLRKGDNGVFCCLGVACDVFCKTTGRGQWEKASLRERGWLFTAPPLEGEDEGLKDSRTELPESVRKWLGLRTRIGQMCVVVDDAMPLSLAGLNDESRLTFEQLADIIERHEDELFFPDELTAAEVA